MRIVAAEYDQWGQIIVTIEDQPPDMTIWVPDDMANKDRQEVAVWAAQEGNEIKEYQAPETKPAPPTIEERLAALEAKLGV